MCTDPELFFIILNSVVPEVHNDLSVLWVEGVQDPDALKNQSQALKVKPSSIEYPLSEHRDIAKMKFSCGTEAKTAREELKNMGYKCGNVNDRCLKTYKWWKAQGFKDLVPDVIQEVGKKIAAQDMCTVEEVYKQWNAPGSDDGTLPMIWIPGW